MGSFSLGWICGGLGSEIGIGADSRAGADGGGRTSLWLWGSSSGPDGGGPDGGRDGGDESDSDGPDGGSSSFSGVGYCCGN